MSQKSNCPNSSVECPGIDVNFERLVLPGYAPKYLMGVSGMLGHCFCPCGAACPRKRFSVDRLAGLSTGSLAEMA